MNLREGQGLIFMKVGTHAGEPLAHIIERKRREISDAGVAFWGYGGNTCHPVTKVQPFARQLTAQGQTIFLCMQEMISNHFADQIRAAQYSADGGQTYQDIHRGINVLGSRFALVIDTLDPDEFELPLERTQVAVGARRGVSGARYIQGRVDKACLMYKDAAAAPAAAERVKINLVARLVEPYAVLLRTPSREG
jgi:hypothetical protein